MRRIGRYIVERKLASGGMSEVFLARDASAVEIARPVALKRLFPNLAAHPVIVELFRHEARLLAAMAHPLVPHVYDFGRDGPTWFLAMEYIPGVTLDTLAPPGAPLPLEHAITIGLQLLEGLAHVHARQDTNGRPLQVIHRDVTSGNVLVTDDGVVRLIDFGIATSTFLRPRDASGALRGTMAYLPPEVITGEGPMDHRVDLFSVGVVLYEITTGARPFAGNSLETMQAIVECAPLPPSRLRPGYPEALEQVILRALAKRPEQRFDSALAMAEQLRRVALVCGWVPSWSALGAFVRAYRNRQ